MKKKRKEKSPQLEKKISIQDVPRHQGKGISLQDDAAPRWEQALRWETFQKCLKSWGRVCKDRRGPWAGAGVRSWGGGRSLPLPPGWAVSSSRLIQQTQWERMLRPRGRQGPGRREPPTTSRQWCCPAAGPSPPRVTGRALLSDPKTTTAK